MDVVKRAELVVREKIIKDRIKAMTVAAHELLFTSKFSEEDVFRMFNNTVENLFIVNGVSEKKRVIILRELAEEIASMQKDGRE